MQEVPQEIKEIASKAKESPLPQKSKDLYELVYDAYQKWCKKMKVSKISEDGMLAFFNTDLANYKSFTLWSKYSILRSTIKLKEGVDINTLPSLIAFLNRKGDGYKSKKSLALTQENVEKFLTGADDEHHLLNKVFLYLE